MKILANPWLATFIIVALLSTGCDDDPLKQSTPKPAKTPLVAPAAPQTTENREAFGVPFPPQVVSVRRIPGIVQVGTSLKLNEVKSFYDSKLVDYELVENSFSLKYFGLREYLPRVNARQMASSAPTIVEIVNRVPKKKPVPVALTDEGEPVPRKPLVPPKDGEPVMTRTADGKLFAPGARWNEPYTPPKGSPLAAKRYRSHWGKPFGKWGEQ